LLSDRGSIPLGSTIKISHPNGWDIFMVAGGIERSKMQMSGGHLLPPVQKLVVRYIFSPRREEKRCKSIPLGKKNSLID